uniref:EB domain-containing protein n=2 Tax=Bursaphelenchus xylophilus TaxID=6326 RepID=A0A1I7SHT6_BURXY
MRAQSRLKQLSLVTSLDRDYTCPLQYVGPEILNRQERQCFSPGTRGECSAGFICATSLEDGNVNICCGPSDNQRDESRFRCPNPGQIEVLENGRNRFCDAYSNDCPRLSTCQSALNSYQMMICCFSATSETPLCPADSIPQPSTAGFVPCDLNRGNQCDNGYICIPSANQPQSSVCCSRVNSNAHICPNQQSLYLDNGRPRICTPQQINPCPTGFTCSQSVANSGTYICCSLPTTATCPVSYTVVIGVNGPIHCNVNNQNDCPADSQCLRSPNQVQSAVCCQSSNAPRVCPEGMSALLLPNNQIERCTGPGSTCPVSGYTCQLSNSLSAWVCCGHGRSQVLCQNGDVPYSQQFGTPFRCNLFAFPSECPVNYVCQSSSQANTNVCCPSNSPGPNPTPEPFPPFEPTLRPPAADLTCPTGWSPFEDSEGAYHFCQHPLDRQCPQ